MKNLAALLAPTADDIEYTQSDQLIISLICRADSYKFTHAYSYADGIQGMSCYGTARVDTRQTMVPFGLQLFIKKYMTQRITMAHIDEAEKFAMGHFNRPLFSRKDWELVVTEFGGALPLIIRAAPEGMPVRGGSALYSVTCIHDQLFWLSTYVETMLLRAVWYPTTIATNDYQLKREIKHYYEITGSDMKMLPFSLHDFGARGVASAEQAEIGGAAHLVSFMGSDTVEGIMTANFYYNEGMAAYSVAATEHSVECSFGLDSAGEHAYLSRCLELAGPGTIVSIVIDGKDVYRCTEMLCTVFRDRIIASKAKIVFRPDSGDMQEVVPRLLRMQEMAFGYEMTSRNFKAIKYVGILQGDGVDHLSLISLLGKLVTMGYAAQCVMFGSGGALLQKVNRDTYKFAQKASAILKDGVWVGISKDPVTDPGKKSLEGMITLVRSKMTGELQNARLDDHILNEEFTDMHELVYYYGRLFNETSLSEVRARAQ